MQDFVWINKDDIGEFWISKGWQKDKAFTHNSYEKIKAHSTGYYNTDEDNMYVNYLDVNSDGLTDIVRTMYSDYATTDVIVYINNGSVNNFTISSSSLSFKVDKTCKPAFGDFNGDGVIELSFRSRNASEGINFVFFNTNRSPTDRRLVGVKNGFKNQILFSYETLSESFHNENSEKYTSSQSSTYPIVDLLGGALPVVSLVTSIENITGNTVQSKYSYSDGVLDYGGKGLLGFKGIDVIDLSKKVLVRKTADYLFGSLLETDVVTYNYIGPYGNYTDETGLADSVVTTYAAIEKSYGGEDTKFVYPERVVSKKYNLGVANKVADDTTLNKYDINGFLYEQVVRNAIHHKITEYKNPESVVSLSNIPPSLPKKVITTITNLTGEQDSYKTVNSYTYEKGKVKTKTIFCKDDGSADPNNSLTTTYLYNRYGLPEQTSIYSHKGDGTRTTYKKYEEKGRFVTEKENQLGHTAKYGDFDLYGNPRRIEGINGLVNLSWYNNLGQLVKTTSPEGVTSHKQYHWVEDNATNAEVVLHYETNTVEGVQGETSTYYDALNREIHTYTTDALGETIKTSKFYYLDLLAAETLPYKGEYYEYSPRTHYTYDSYNRLDLVVQPYAGTTKYTYEGLTTKVKNSWDKEESRITKNIAGQVVEKNDRGNTITYNYYAHGGVNEIVAAGKTIKNTYYDITAKQKILNDPDFGPMVYEYNSFGELTKQTDQKGNTTIIDEIDPLGRVLHKQEIAVVVPSGFSKTTNYSYTYDQGLMAKGKLSKATNGIHTIENEFDTYGRLKEKKETALGDEYIYQYSYDELSRLKETLYPTGLKVKDKYNEFGFVEATFLNDREEPVWEALDYDEQGRLNEETVLGKTCFYQYVNGRLSYRRGYNHSRYYDFDAASGNLKSRRNGNKGIREEFYYDDYHRLESSIVTDVDGNTFETSKVTYDKNGHANIASKKGVGEYMYNNTDSKHRVSGVKNMEFDVLYTSTFNQTVKYNAFNSISEVSQDNYTLTLQYGLDQQRIYTELSQFTPSNIVKRKTFLDGFEIIEDRDGVQFVHPVGDVLAVKDATNNQWSYYWMQKDYLGSIEVITDENGDLVQEHSFGAWGARRNPETWLSFEEGENVPDLLFDRGYTGHEHIEQCDLINMNGRVYDPLLGMMLSPDNYVHNATDFQNFNRYSYCFNNPMKYTDPDGETPLLVAVALGAAIGVTTNGISNTINNDPFFQGAGTAAIIGAASGLVSNVIGNYFSSAAASAMSPTSKVLWQASMHAHLGGMSSLAMGGRYSSGFAAGAVSSLASAGTEDFLKQHHVTNKHVIGGAMVATGGITGGIGSVFAGGNFWDGMRNGLVSSGLNHAAHLGEEAFQKGGPDEPVTYTYNGEEGLTSSELYVKILIDQAAEQFGIKDIAALTAVLTGAPILETRGKFQGATKGTSIASKYLSKIPGKFPVAMPSVTGYPKVLGGKGMKLAMTKVIGRFVGRAVPIVGWGILMYDVGVTLYNTQVEYNKITGGGL